MYKINKFKSDISCILRIDHERYIVYNNIKLRVNHSEIKMKGLDIMLKWFRQCTTVKEAKSQYHKLCRKYHPDMSGEDTTAIMQEINAEFTKVFAELQRNEARQQNTKAKDNSTTHTTNNTTEQAAERFMHIIQRLVRCEGLVIEIVGNWIWISGTTYKYLRCIKSLGFKYSTKQKRYYYTEDYCGNNSRSRLTYDQIKEKYGYQEIKTINTPKLAV